MMSIFTAIMLSIINKFNELEDNFILIQILSYSIYIIKGEL
jgi:hypothetical protein